MIERKNIRIMTPVDCKLFLQIEKNHYGSYLIKISEYANFEFISTVVEMIQKYGDLFAAYVETINPHLSITEKETLVGLFPATLKNLTVIVTKTDEFEPDHDWGSSEVKHLKNLTKFTEYQGHLYLFTKESE